MIDPRRARMATQGYPRIVKFGIELAGAGATAEAAVLADLARTAEHAG
jgi:hypothetical protein